MTEPTQDLLNDDDTTKPKPRYFISETDFSKLDTSREDLPYMKYVELTNLTPQHFGLDCWVPNFRIPDYWMKKIYINDVYRDTDLPDPEPETLSEAQKKILLNYYSKNHYGSPYKSDKRNLRPSRHQVPPADDLIELLEAVDCRGETNRVVSFESDDYDVDGESEQEEEESEDADGKDADTSGDIQLIQIDSDSNEQVLSMTPHKKERRKKKRKRRKPNLPSSPLPLGESRTTDNNIAILRHKVQTEKAVVEMVLDKMKHLEPKEERRYQELLKDKEFMKLLDSHAEKYAKMDPT